MIMAGKEPKQGKGQPLVPQIYLSVSDIELVNFNTF